MAASTSTVPLSDLPIPPGEFLAEELEARGMTQSDLARRMGRPSRLISDVIHARAAITPEIARELEAALGPSARFWQGLEEHYRLTLDRVAGEAAMQEDETKVPEFPAREVV